jgi:hypothetical protein
MERDRKPELAHVGVNRGIAHREAIVGRCEAHVTADTNVPADANNGSGTEIRITGDCESAKSNARRDEKTPSPDGIEAEAKIESAN